MTQVAGPGGQRCSRMPGTRFANNEGLLQNQHFLFLSHGRTGATRQDLPVSTIAVSNGGGPSVNEWRDIMLLWKTYSPAGAYPAEDKRALSETITNIYAQVR